MNNENPAAGPGWEDTSEDTRFSERLQVLARKAPGDRMREAQEQMNAPGKCTRCGSTWFMEHTFHQYRAGTYGSTPGGDLEVVSQMPMTIRICLCGMPYTPNVGGSVHGGATPNENLLSFNGSLDAAQHYILNANAPTQAPLAKAPEDVTVDAVTKIAAEQARKALSTSGEIKTLTEGLAAVNAELHKPAAKRGRPKVEKVEKAAEPQPDPKTPETPTGA